MAASTVPNPNMEQPSQPLIPGFLLAKRYQLRHCLNQQQDRRASRETWLANDSLATDGGPHCPVVIKLLTFGHSIQWKDFKLFEREAETLKSLNHPSIPRYIDAFEVDLADCQGFALVQSYVEAKSLKQHIEAGCQFSQADLQDIASQLLSILHSIHSNLPPVIHRDIKPSNILLSDRSAHSPGQVSLVDFGSVTLGTKQNPENLGSITIVGSYGYMAPEQYHGQAKPASDLYGLGATLAYLATGHNPIELPIVDGVIQVPTVRLQPTFAAWVQTLLKIQPSQRFPSARAAQTALQNNDLSWMPPQGASSMHNSNLPDQSSNSSLLVHQTEEELTITTPKQGWDIKIILIEIARLCFGLFCIPFILFIAAIVFEFLPLFGLELSRLLLMQAASGIFVILCLKITLNMASEMFGITKLSLDAKQVSKGDWIFGLCYKRDQPIRRAAIQKVVYTPSYWERDSEGDRKRFSPSITIVGNQRQLSFGGKGSRVETSEPLEWLARSIGATLNVPVEKSFED